MSTSVLLPPTTEELFNAAVEVIRGLPPNGSYQPSNQLMLRFYGFYKQATLGPCKQAKPGFWDIVGRAKWEAWNKLGQMTKEEAMNGYIEELKKIVETMAYTENIDRFMDVLEPFFELTDIPKPESKQNSNQERFVHDDEKMRISKEGLSEKYNADSDSENEEFVDPSEERIDELSVVKKLKSDHNDNDSGFADHVEYYRSYQNGTDAMQIDGSTKWRSTYVNGTNENDSPSPHHAAQADFINVDFGKGIEPLNVQGIVARGGGEENGTNVASGPPLGRRGGHAPDNRGVGSRDTLNQPNLGALNRRGMDTGVGGSGREGPGRGFFVQQTDDISEQIAMALLRLQRDMDSVLARLNVLETVALAQHNTAQARLSAQINTQSQMQLVNKPTKPFWWPFKELSYRAFFFFLAWPIVFQIILKLVALRRARNTRKF